MDFNKNVKAHNNDFLNQQKKQTEKYQPLLIIPIYKKLALGDKTQLNKQDKKSSVHLSPFLQIQQRLSHFMKL